MYIVAVQLYFLFVFKNRTIEGGIFIFLEFWNTEKITTIVATTMNEKKMKKIFLKKKNVVKFKHAKII